MKKLIIVLLSMFMVINFMPLSAKTLSNKGSNSMSRKNYDYYRIVEENGKSYIVDIEGNCYSEFHDAHGNEISIDDAFAILTGSNMDINTIILPSIEPMYIPDVGVVSVEIYSVNRHYYGTPIKVSADMTGPGTITYTQAKEITHSYSGVLSAELDLIKGKLQLQLGYEYCNSLMSSNSYQLKVDAGKTAAIYFKPCFTKVTGRYTDNSTGVSKNYTVQSPNKVANGEADGVYYLVYR